MRHVEVEYMQLLEIRSSRLTHDVNHQLDIVALGCFSRFLFVQQQSQHRDFQALLRSQRASGILVVHVRFVLDRIYVFHGGYTSQVPL